jgi:hypothetical protein
MKTSYNTIIQITEATMARTLTALLIIVSASLCAMACKQFMPGKNTGGKINFLAGDVTVNGKKAAAGDTVRFDDVIETGDNSTCHVIIGERNILALSPKSRLLYRITTRGSNLELTRGGLGALIRNRDFTGDMNVRANTVTASVRGTIFYIAVENSEKTYTCVCNGRVRLIPESGNLLSKGNDGGEKLVSAKHHAGHYYIKEKGSVITETAGLLYHTDKGVEKMAAAIGEKVDWTRIE